MFFLHFTPGNSRENKALPLETSKNYVTCLCNFKRQKQRPLEIPHGFFLITPGNTSMLLINSWKCHLLFLQKPWKFICSTLSFSFFSGRAQSISMKKVISSQSRKLNPPLPQLWHDLHFTSWLASYLYIFCTYQIC